MTKPNCWWCCHPFEWESLHFPYTFKSNIFYTTGHFCSWECMKAYAIDREKLEQCEYITLMRKRMEGKVVHTRKAPNKFSLEMFGGTMNINDFRIGKPHVIKIPGEVFQSHTVIQDVTNKDSVLCSGGDNLKLKREKPLERSKGKLETSLGIIRKCRTVADSGKSSQNKTKD